MNLAFYMMVSSALFVVWVVIIFGFDRLSYWRFRGAQIERVQRFASVVGRAPESYSVMHVRLTRFSDDILDHKILGLGIVGLGTSDIEGKIAIFGGGNGFPHRERVEGHAHATADPGRWDPRRRSPEGCPVPLKRPRQSGFAALTTTRALAPTPKLPLLG
jgi:hypothetical protein